MKYTNKFGLPQALVDAVCNDGYHRGKSDITTTELIQPPIHVLLRREYDGELEEDVSDRVWALMGSAVHHVLDRSSRGELTETRLYMEMDGWLLGGQLDNLNLESGVLSDYKMTSVYSLLYGDKPEWTAQLNVLAQLAIENGYKVEKLQIIVLARDWSVGKSNSPDYPKCQVQVVDIPLWLESERMLYIRSRVRLHQEACVRFHEGGASALSECSPEERWEKQAKFAVMKEGRKSAVKLHDSASSAASHVAELGAKHYVVERKGERTRCERYCVLSKNGKCPFYKIQGETDEE